MAEDREADGIKIGNRIYFGHRFKNPELQRLILEWEEFDYCKFSTIQDQMEWSIMEVLLMEEEFELSFVGTSYVEYPSIPYDDFDRARKILEAAKEARSLMQDFLLPERASGESLRTYQARVADQLES